MKAQSVYNFANLTHFAGGHICRQCGATICIARIKANGNPATLTEINPGEFITHRCKKYFVCSVTMAAR